MPQNLPLLLEELSINAWPSLQTVYDDGWLVRFANGYTGRANSVNALYPSSDDLEAKIKRCEERYTARRQETIFKISPAVQPPELDSVLDRLGYRRNKPTSTQTATLVNLPAPQLANSSLSTQLSDQWFEDFCALRDVEPRTLPIMRQMIGNIVPPMCFAAIHDAGAPVALGLAVLERGYVGLYDIVTAEQARNRGLGTQLILHLLNWAKANGATHSYLQVMLDNAPALHLYGKLGYQEVYQYWYRTKAMGA
jgi:GNAT superfamily N-acetyltransferase